MNIFVIGQCSLHWGRMEFGNIGNYYIIEPLIKELHENFPNAKICTTFQMSDDFCARERVRTVPMECYYSWSDEDLQIAQFELQIAQKYVETGELTHSTEFIKEVLNADLVIDFSGDIWGDNADFLGPHRFLVGLLKDRVAQLLCNKVVMIAGSPGPFNNESTVEFAKAVYSNFTFVTNREAISTELLRNQGFDVSKTFSLVCPAYLFQGNNSDIIPSDLQKLKNNERLTVGMILCGWNFETGPYNKEIWYDDEFIKFASLVEYITESLGHNVCLMSHSNGFDIPPKQFRLKHGRDYSILKQLEKVLKNRNISKHFSLIEDVLDAWSTKAVIKNFDMLISGRIHGAVAGLSQCIPTVIIDYGHEPKAHKLEGFAAEVNVSQYVANPASLDDMIDKVDTCTSNLHSYQKLLQTKIPLVKYKAKQNFQHISNLFYEK